jgi:small GTP-binding protein
MPNSKDFESNGGEKTNSNDSSRNDIKTRKIKRESPLKSDFVSKKSFTETSQRFLRSQAVSQIARKYKVIILGNTTAGKTSVFRRLNGEEFSPFTTMSLKIDFRLISKQYYNQTFEIDLWDTFGQERFHSLMPMYYRGADAAIVIYDVTSRETFDTLSKWFEELEEKSDENISIILIANKCDEKSKRQVEFCEGQGLMNGNAKICKFFEVSAKFDTNLENVMDFLFLHLIEKKSYIWAKNTVQLEADRSQKNGGIKDGKKGVKEKKSCC